MRVRLLEPATQELHEAIGYYNAQVSGLGDEFLLETLRTLGLVRQYPRAWHPLGGDIRRCRLSRFPYAVIYAPDGDDIVVIAIAHMHRHPTYWHDRLTNRT